MLSREVRHRSGLEVHPENESEFSTAVIWTSVAICVSLVGLGFWGHFGLADPLLSQICLHIAIAAIVAFILILTLEFNARRFSRLEAKQFRDLVSQDVFQALFGRIVPPEVFYEIEDVLRRDTVRRNCRYRITFLPKEGMPAGYCVIRREVMFDVQNLLNRDVEFDVKSSHSNDEDLGSEAWPHSDFHVGLKINNQAVDLKAEHLTVDGNFTRMKYKVALAPGEVKSIWLQGEEPSRISSGRNTYLQGTPVIGIDVEVRNDVPLIDRVDVSMNHAEFKAEQDDFGHYFLKRAFLPGQGFQVTWKAKRVELPGLVPEALSKPANA
jgi:hypothetical protein